MKYIRIADKTTGRRAIIGEGKAMDLSKGIKWQDRKWIPLTDAQREALLKEGVRQLVLSDNDVRMYETGRL